jgi:hypothetical protein
VHVQYCLCICSEAYSNGGGQVGLLPKAQMLGRAADAVALEAMPGGGENDGDAIALFPAESLGHPDATRIVAEWVKGEPAGDHPLEPTSWIRNAQKRLNEEGRADNAVYADLMRLAKRQYNESKEAGEGVSCTIGSMRDALREMTPSLQVPTPLQQAWRM